MALNTLIIRTILLQLTLVMALALQSDQASKAHLESEQVCKVKWQFVFKQPASCCVVHEKVIVCGDWVNAMQCTGSANKPACLNQYGKGALQYGIAPCCAELLTKAQHS